VQSTDLPLPNDGNASRKRCSSHFPIHTPPIKPGNSTTSCPRTDSVSELAYRCYFLNTSRGLVMSPIPMTTNSHPAAPYSLSVFCMAVLSGGTSTTL
jgi:hypothetical protein